MPRKLSPRGRKGGASRAAAVACAALSTPFAAAQVTTVWSNAAGGAWSDGQNWSPFGPPTEFDDAVFGLTLAGPVTFSDLSYANALLVQKGNVQFALGTRSLSVGSILGGGLQVGTIIANPATATFGGSAAGALDAASVTIATSFGSAGTLNIKGIDVGTSSFPTIVAGALGNATLTIDEGAFVVCTQLRAAIAPTSTATIDIVGGASVSCIDLAIFGNAALSLDPTGTLTAGSGINAYPNATITGDGTLVIPVCDDGGDVGFKNFGTVLPGAPIGALSVSGQYKQFGVIPGLGTDSGAYVVDATTTGGRVAHDVLDVTCSATLGGLLQLAPLGEFDPPVGTEMVVLTAGSLVSTFDVVLLPSLPGRFISVEYNGAGGVAGDANVTLVVGSLGGGVAIGEPALATLDGAPLAIAPGNIDGENDLPDLAIAIPDDSDPTGENGTLVVLFDLAPAGPSLSYGSIRTFGVGREPRSLALGDIDGNGADDIAVANASSDGVDVYFMSGERPVAQTSIAVGDRPMDVALASLGGVAGLDLVTANMEGNSVTTFGYDGAFGFAPTGTLAAVGPCSVDPIDFNGDGKLDLAVGLFSSSSVAAFSNGGAGVFSLAQTIPVGAGPIDVLGADFNGDGAVDLVTSNLLDGTVSVVKNGGSGSAPFAPAVELPVGAAGPIVGSLAVIDLGEDLEPTGDPEILVVASESADPRSPRVLRVLRNDSKAGSGTIAFADAVTLSTGGNTLVVAATGPNAKGPSDLIVLNEPEGGVAEALHSVLAALPVGAPRKGPPSDLNDDGSVNAIDLGILLGAWGACAGCAADLDANASVGPTDLGILLGDWTG